MHTDTHKDIAVRSLHAMATDSPDAFDGLIHPEATNREAIHEPPACRGRGTEAFEATARWLQEAWSDIAFTVEECIAQDDLVVTHGTMSGRHTGPFTVYAPEGQVAQVFPATGRRFHVNHAHFFRLRDGLIVEHWAVRDDRALAEQLGWAPPTPLYALRMTLATRSARRGDGRSR